MFTTELNHFMNLVVSWLLQPVIFALMVALGAAIWETGIALGERLGGLKSLSLRYSVRDIERLARKRIERVDLLAKISPMIGLMGTLIPLGPGLAALGQGDLELLATAVIVAFNTTVIGLLVGVVGFVLGRFRRRWYDDLLDRLENQAMENKEQVEKYEELTPVAP